MSIDPKAIAGLFEVSRDAVVGINQNKILFINPAASALFQANPGDPAEQHIPSYILNDPAEHFIASVQRDNHAGSASVSRTGDFTLLSVSFPEVESAVPSVLSGSVHELSNALMATRLAADVLLEHLDCSSDEKLKNHSAILYQSYYRMKRLCEHISKADSLHRGTLHLNTRVVALDRMCSELLDSLSHFLSTMGISLEFEAEKGRYNTLADASLLETLIMNAITNSASHIPAGTKGRILLRLTKQSDRIIIAIDDNGTGISAKRLSPIMSDFTGKNLRDPSAGAGLGMQISRGIAELHGGALILESREGQGTKLRISLPIRLPEDPLLCTPAVAYNKDGMNHILTELSVILDKKFYNKTLFD